MEKQARSVWLRGGINAGQVSTERGVGDNYWGEEVRQRHVEVKSLCSAAAGALEKGRIH